MQKKIRHRFVCLTAIFLMLVILLIGKLFDGGRKLVTMDANELATSKPLTNEDWNFSFRYPAYLKIPVHGDSQFYFTPEATEAIHLNSDEFAFGFARMGDGTGEAVIDLYDYVASAEPTADATYSQLAIGPYEGLREVTPEMERIYVRTGINDVWYFYVPSSNPQHRQIFEKIISTIKID